MKQLFCVMLIIVTALFVVPAHAAPKSKKPVYTIDVSYLNDWVNNILIDRALHAYSNPLLPVPDMLGSCAGQCDCASALGKQNGAKNNGTTCWVNGVQHSCIDYCGM